MLGVCRAVARLQVPRPTRQCVGGAVAARKWRRVMEKTKRREKERRFIVLTPLYDLSTMAVACRFWYKIKLQRPWLRSESVPKTQRHSPSLTHPDVQSASTSSSAENWLGYEAQSRKPSAILGYGEHIKAS
ncbi:hypothetical protein Ddye_002173 [Dipteronia dyeriana]|uniref:Uncharacterized protein n=1 Tax=Dipteronia dyeriana TaxID=168575 RepID=A0AAD9XPX2_9ROSI|nr:hypothetical protein Ddye_002173 [Dipteronia dyeriana]